MKKRMYIVLLLCLLSVGSVFGMNPRKEELDPESDDYGKLFKIIKSEVGASLRVKFSLELFTLNDEELKNKLQTIKKYVGDKRKICIDCTGNDSCPSKITDEQLSVLVKTFEDCNIVELDLWRCSEITDTAIKALAANCTNLQKLNLGLCSQITDDGISALANCKKLQILDLRGCKKIWV